MDIENMKEICTISMPRNGLDNDYTFYKGGKILHYYDRHIYKNGMNLEEWLSADQISEETKEKLLEKCPKEHLIEVMRLLGKA